MKVSGTRYDVLDEASGWASAAKEEPVHASGCLGGLPIVCEEPIAIIVGRVVIATRRHRQVELEDDALVTHYEVVAVFRLVQRVSWGRLDEFLGGFIGAPPQVGRHEHVEVPGGESRHLMVAIRTADIGEMLEEGRLQRLRVEAEAQERFQMLNDMFEAGQVLLRIPSVLGCLQRDAPVLLVGSKGAR
jgi:hypothetical protein